MPDPSQAQDRQLSNDYMEEDKTEGVCEDAAAGLPSLRWRAGISLLRARYLLGHLEADVGAELEHLTHLFWGGWDQGDLLHGG